MAWEQKSLNKDAASSLLIHRVSWRNPGRVAELDRCEQERNSSEEEKKRRFRRQPNNIFCILIKLLILQREKKSQCFKLLHFPALWTEIIADQLRRCGAGDGFWDCQGPPLLEISRSWFVGEPLSACDSFRSNNRLLPTKHCLQGPTVRTVHCCTTLF